MEEIEPDQVIAEARRWLSAATHRTLDENRH
jgi:hypothetical protein